MCVYVRARARICMYVCVFRATAKMINAEQREGAIKIESNFSNPGCNARWTSASYESGSLSFS